MSKPQGLLARIRGQLQRDEGWAGTVILLLATLFLLLAAFQGALWANGSNVAEASAQAGYTVARSYESTAQAGRTAALELITGIPGSLSDANVTVTRTAETVTVTVAGRVKSILPGITMPLVTQTITGPVERWVPAP